MTQQLATAATDAKTQKFKDTAAIDRDLDQSSRFLAEDRLRDERFFRNFVTVIVVTLAAGIGIPWWFGWWKAAIATAVIAGVVLLWMVFDTRKSPHGLP